MEYKVFFRLSTLLSFGGVLFAGYLSATKLISGVCPFREPCPYFLGYPACWYGLGLFCLLFGGSVLGLMEKGSRARLLVFLEAVSLVGIFFAGSFVIRELINALKYGWPSYTLLLPTCAYGLIFYTIIFILGRRTQKSLTEPNPTITSV